MEIIPVYLCISKNYRYSEDDLKLLVETKKTDIINWVKENNKKYDLNFYIEYVEGRLKLNERPVINKLKEDIKNSRISKIIIDDPYSLYESMEFMVDFVNYVEEYECEIESINGTNMHEFKDIAQVYLDLKKPVREENLR